MHVIKSDWLANAVASRAYDSGRLAGLDALFVAERSDAAAIGPNDSIKVTKIETFVLKSSWVFVKISTDAGITGWGEMLKDDAKVRLSRRRFTQYGQDGRFPIELIQLN